MENLSEREQYLRDAVVVARELAQPHIDAPGSRIIMLPHEPENEQLYPGQDPLVNHITGDPQPEAVTDAIANQVMPSFIEIKTSLSKDSKTMENIQGVREHLGKGGNVAVVTSHAELFDIAFGLKLVGDLLGQKGSRPDLAIVVSKVIAEMGYDLGGGAQIANLAALRMLCRDIYLSWPKTDSAKSALSNLPSAEIRRHNIEMKAVMKQQLDRGGVVLAVAPTGTTRAEQDATGAVQLAPVSKGTLEILQHPRMKVLPVYVQFEGQSPAAAIPHALMSLHSEAQVEAIQAVLAQMHAEQLQAKTARTAQLGRAALQE